MSRKRRNFSAKFKSDLVIELLKGEKDLNTLATENNIQPNLLRNWKREFLNNASAVFDDKREENLKEKLVEERKEKAEYAKKVGQLTMQVDWFKKSEEICGSDYESKFSPKLLTTKEIPLIKKHCGFLHSVFPYFVTVTTGPRSSVFSDLMTHVSYSLLPSVNVRQLFLTSQSSR